MIDVAFRDGQHLGTVQHFGVQLGAGLGKGDGVSARSAATSIMQVWPAA